MLKDLKDVNKNVHLLLTSYNLVEIYVYDVLKKRCNATLESIIDVNNTSSFRTMLEYVNVQPNLADYWLFVIDYSKVKSQIKKNMGIFQSETSVFLLKVSNYKDFKEFMQECNVTVNSLYLNVIRRGDVYDLLRPYNLSEKVKEFVATSYYKDPEKVFILQKELKNGISISKPKDVISLCGESTNSIQKFVMQLLLDTPKTKLFLKRGYKKRVNTLYTLCETFNPRTAYNYIRATVKDILYIKMLYLEGRIYDKIRDLPECYDEAKLSRYSFMLKTISQGIEYEKILSLYSMLTNEGKWYSVQDGISFLYKYYLGLLDLNKEAV